MASNAQITANCTKDEARVPIFMEAPLKFAQEIGAGFRSGLKRAFHAFQIAQAKSALSQLSNSQLAAMGIKRHQIADHAEYMVGPKTV